MMYMMADVRGGVRSVFTAAWFLVLSVFIPGADNNVIPSQVNPRSDSCSTEGPPICSTEGPS
jgi:hypothetical protein